VRKEIKISKTITKEVIRTSSEPPPARVGRIQGREKRVPEMDHSG
jgi:hypothetical protein